MAIILQFYPNGEFTHGVDSVASRRKNRAEKKSDEMTAIRTAYAIRDEICADMRHELISAQTWEGAQFESSYANYSVLQCDSRTWYYCCEPKDTSLDPYVIDSEDNPPRFAHLRGAVPLGSSDGRIFTTPVKSRKKCLRMTSSMGRNIRNACYLLEEHCGKENLSFLTLTLPDLPAEALERCASQWGRMVDQFLKSLRARLESQKIPFHYVYCTEVQTKRLENYGQFALHLHLLFGGKLSRRGTWGVSPRWCRRQWVRCIKSVYPGDFEQSALENLQRIKKSAGAYMSKYLSKCSGTGDGEGNQHPGIHFNGHWGGMSRHLSKTIKKSTRRFRSDMGEYGLIRNILRGLGRGDFAQIVAYYKAGFIPIHAGDSKEQERGLHVGVGALRRPLSKGSLEYLIHLSYSIGEE